MTSLRENIVSNLCCALLIIAGVWIVGALQEHGIITYFNRIHAEAVAARAKQTDSINELWRAMDSMAKQPATQP